MLVLELCWIALTSFWCANFAPRTEFGVCSLEDCVGFFWEFNFPALGEYAEDAECAACAEPAFCYLFQVLHAMDNVSLRILFRQIKEVNRACRMCDVHADVTDLP